MKLSDKMKSELMASISAYANNPVKIDGDNAFLPFDHIELCNNEYGGVRVSYMYKWNAIAYNDVVGLRFTNNNSLTLQGIDGKIGIRIV